VTSPVRDAPLEAAAITVTSLFRRDADLGATPQPLALLSALRRCEDWVFR
jgi:hypothetical protein